MKVVTFQINDAQAKLKQLIRVATDHFKRREGLLILAPNRAAAEYIDTLLWRHPEESFLPHATGSMTTKELVAITDEPFNVNQAKAIFNLRPEPVEETLGAALIYELEDLSSSEAQEAFKKKFNTYRAQNFSILAQE